MRNTTPIAIALFGLFLSGCSGTTINDVSPLKPLYQLDKNKKMERYNAKIMQVGLSTQSNPNYKRIALDNTENKTWFKELTYQLWDREITKAEFVAHGVEKYPDRQYEFEFIAEGFNLQD